MSRRPVCIALCLFVCPLLLALATCTAEAQWCCSADECIGRSPRNGSADPSAQYVFHIWLRDNSCIPVVGYPAENVVLRITPACPNPVYLHPEGPSDQDGRMVWNADLLNQGGGACSGPSVVEITVAAQVFWTFDAVHSPDIEGDGLVALSDLMIWQVAFVTQTPEHVGNMNCDEDGFIALNDLLWWQKHFVAP